MTVTDYILENIDRSIYLDAPGTGFGGVHLPHHHTSSCIKGEGHFHFFHYRDIAFAQTALYQTGRADIARKSLQNILWLIRCHGYVSNHVGPNNRSQPPYLRLMVHDYFAHLGGPSADPTFFCECADSLLTEYNWWMSARHHGSGLNHYGSHETGEGLEAFSANERVAKLCPSADASSIERRRIGAHSFADSETARLATAEYNPRPMMGWTAGVYLQFQALFGTP